MRTSPFLTVTLVLAATPFAHAQLNLTPLFSFVDSAAGGNGNIGVTQDEVLNEFHVIDFSNSLTVHQFNSVGQLVNQFATSTCAPPATSPNDIVWDPDTDSLWIVDNGGPTVLNVSRTGTCLGGFLTTGISNPTGIGYDRASQKLLIAGQSAVVAYDKLGNPTPGGFSFSPASGSQFLAGITTFPVTGNHLIVQSAGNQIFEVSPSGALVSTTDLSVFGIGNTQGIHYNHANGTLLVVDNTLSTTFVFAAGCIPPTSYGSGCAGAGGFTPKLAITGCPELGKVVSLSINDGLGGAPSLVFVSFAAASVPIGGGCELLVQPTPLALPIPLGGAGPGNGSATLVGPIPLASPIVDVFLQAFVGDNSNPAGFTASNGVKMAIQ